ncbi:hypothetical protein CEUSTIGMA_g12969.t1 [Chlamydomonas eustigma]|uniref:Uncharacterized protein n=1 Tax=Chlamydomonas eustigma TaxID=1157962 RepID=A0A250XR72_9CHLO|nr:hypothetical protein CEUSTIGMA_g12969.t1 [Chlamydomonas eustigma]|eukprot:GAX85554.1 hypothetical protein CEUSTIGMA_g12969.t1 [Chlamydomonas eustigma]
MDQRLQAQEFAAQTKQAAFEKKLLKRVDSVDDDQAFFRGEVQAQKKSIGELHVSEDKVSTEVTSRLAEQVKVQHELKADISDQVASKDDLDNDVWHGLDALQEAVFPNVSSQPPALVEPQESLSFVPLYENPLQPTPWIENSVYHPISSSHSPAFHNALSGPPSSSSSGYQSSATFDPNPLNPPPQTVWPQPADHAQQHLVPAVLASRKQRNLPNISEVDHIWGHIHAGARRAPLPHSSPPAHEHPSSSHASEGASHHQHSHAKVPLPAYVPTHVHPSDSHMSAPPVNSVSHRPPPSIITSTDYMPQDSLSLRPPPVQLDQQSSSWIENPLSSGSLPQSPHTPHNALSHSPSPSTNNAADHVQHLLVVPSVPNRERDLPRVTEIDHGGSVVPFRDPTGLLPSVLQARVYSSPHVTYRLSLDMTALMHPLHLGGVMAQMYQLYQLSAVTACPHNLQY